MKNRNMKMVDVRPGFDTEPRGFYRQKVKMFLECGKQEQELIDMDSQTTAYQGLRKAVSEMGYFGKVYVEKKGDRIKLIRRG